MTPSVHVVVVRRRWCRYESVFNARRTDDRPRALVGKEWARMEAHLVEFNDSIYICACVYARNIEKRGSRGGLLPTTSLRSRIRNYVHGRVYGRVIANGGKNISLFEFRSAAVAL